MAISPSHIPPNGSVVTSLDSILRERCSKCGRFLPRPRRRASEKGPYQYVEDAEVATARLMSGRRSRSRSSSRSRRSRKSTSSRRSRRRTSKRKRSKRSRRRSKRSSPKSVRFSRASRRLPITTLHRRRKRKSKRSKVSLSSKSMQRRGLRKVVLVMYRDQRGRFVRVPRHH
ncbi:unnamed protein product [Cylicocyclus nassatus]|uniref:Uncharacterized protein n=1 Tax=Cylicocyclus nassatus TaxID=53992 RepID=A0AA36MC36_CYLNA|nr:unnamed protein product [Cylicocyclus nassatus]